MAGYYSSVNFLAVCICALIVFPLYNGGLEETGPSALTGKVAPFVPVRLQLSLGSREPGIWCQPHPDYHICNHSNLICATTSATMATSSWVHVCQLETTWSWHWQNIPPVTRCYVSSVTQTVLLKRWVSWKGGGGGSHRTSKSTVHNLNDSGSMCDSHHPLQHP